MMMMVVIITWICSIHWTENPPLWTQPWSRNTLFILLPDPNNKEGTYGIGEIEDVRISDCPDAPCILRKGTSATIEFDFQPGKNE